MARLYRLAGLESRSASVPVWDECSWARGNIRPKREQSRAERLVQQPGEPAARGADGRVIRPEDLEVVEHPGADRVPARCILRGKRVEQQVERRLRVARAHRKVSQCQL